MSSERDTREENDRLPVRAAAAVLHSERESEAGVSRNVTKMMKNVSV